MNRTSITAATAVAAVALAGVTVTGASAAPAVNWTARTCAAATAWEHHRTAADLDTLAADSFHVTWRYLGYDVWGLFADVRSGSVKYISADVRYLTADCQS